MKISMLLSDPKTNSSINNLSHQMNQGQIMVVNNININNFNMPNEPLNAGNQSPIKIEGEVKLPNINGTSTIPSSSCNGSHLSASNQNCLSPTKNSKV